MTDERFGQGFVRVAVDDPATSRAARLELGFSASTIDELRPIAR